MNDMSAVIVPKSDQWNADDFFAGPMTFTINEVRIKAGEEQPVDIFVEGSRKAFRPCKSMSRVLVGIWGPDAGKYIGKSLTLYRDPNVRFGKDVTGGIRISHMTDIPEDKLDNGKVVMALTATRAQRKPHVVRPLVVQQQSTQQRQTPAQWLDNHLAEIAAVPVLDALASLQMRSQKALEKLASAHPDLHERAVAAMTERHEQLSNPAAAEKRDDPDMGDPFDGDDFADTRNKGEE